MVNRVLVTGITGFVGRHVVTPLLERGFDVHGVARARGGDPRTQVNVADLLEAGSARRVIDAVRPSHLLHLAWAPTKVRLSPEDNRAWLRASLDLFEAFVAAGGRRAVFGGTCAEYDWTHERLVENETPLRPRTVYGACKNELRQAVETSAGQATVAWARLFFLYGPHEPAGRLVPDICRALIAGHPVELTEGRQERDYMHVADVGRALAMMLAGEAKGAVNVASGSCVPVRDLALRLGAITGRTDLLQFGRRSSPPDDPPKLWGDTRRLTQEVGFVPRFDLESGLADTLAWWRSQRA